MKLFFFIVIFINPNVGFQQTVFSRTKDVNYFVGKDLVLKHYTMLISFRIPSGNNSQNEC